MKKLPEIDWDRRNIKPKEWYFATTLLLCSHISMWLAIFNGIVLGVIGTTLMISSIIYLYISGRKIIRINLTAQEQVLLDTSPEGVKFRQMLSNATD
jgi:hypothetical protein